MEINKQQKQLFKLFEMQYELDKEILAKKGIKEYPINRVENALANELQELNQWLEKKWKYWKEHARWYLNDEQSRKEALEEYVDCLHFALSKTLFLFLKKHDFEELKSYTWYDNCKVNNDKIYDESIDNETHALYIFNFISNINFVDYPLSALFDFGHYLGFTWEEIYECYLKKNKINHERQENGY